MLLLSTTFLLYPYAPHSLTHAFNLHPSGLFWQKLAVETICPLYEQNHSTCQIFIPTYLQRLIWSLQSVQIKVSYR